jgi:hypothetical protein
MSEENKNIDQLFSDAAHSESAPQYDSAYWAEMNAMLNTRAAKKRVFLFWALGGSAAFAVLLLSLFTLNMDGSSEKERYVSEEIDLNIENINLSDSRILVTEKVDKINQTNQSATNEIKNAELPLANSNNSTRSQNNNKIGSQNSIGKNRNDSRRNENQRIDNSFKNNNTKVAVHEGNKSNSRITSKQVNLNQETAIKDIDKSISKNLNAKNLNTKKGKWWTNIDSTIQWFGHTNLNYEKTLLYVCSSNKDASVLHQLGYNAIAPHTEAQMFSQDQYDYYSKYFDKIIIFYDNDDTGIKKATKFSEVWDLDYIYLEDLDTKDPFEFIKQYGLNELDEFLKQYI